MILHGSQAGAVSPLQFSALRGIMILYLAHTKAAELQAGDNNVNVLLARSSACFDQLLAATFCRLTQLGKSLDYSCYLHENYNQLLDKGTVAASCPRGMLCSALALQLRSARSHLSIEQNSWA